MQRVTTIAENIPLIHYLALNVSSPNISSDILKPDHLNFDWKWNEKWSSLPFNGMDSDQDSIDLKFLNSEAQNLSNKLSILYKKRRTPTQSSAVSSLMHNVSSFKVKPDIASRMKVKKGILATRRKNLVSAETEHLLRNFSSNYAKLHGYISLAICTFGLISNMLNIAVLSKKNMINPINIILLGIAIADVITMASYLIFAFYFYIPTLRDNNHKYGWALFVLFHFNLTMTLHTISTWVTVFLASFRCLSISKPQFRKRYFDNRMTVICVCVIYVAVIFICLPYYMSYVIIPESNIELGATDMSGGANTIISNNNLPIDNNNKTFNNVSLKSNSLLNFNINNNNNNHHPMGGSHDNNIKTKPAVMKSSERRFAKRALPVLRNAVVVSTQKLLNTSKYSTTVSPGGYLPLNRLLTTATFGPLNTRENPNGFYIKLYPAAKDAANNNRLRNKGKLNRSMTRMMYLPVDDYYLSEDDGGEDVYILDHYNEIYGKAKPREKNDSNYHKLLLVSLPYTTSHNANSVSAFFNGREGNSAKVIIPNTTIIMNNNGATEQKYITAMNKKHINLILINFVVYSIVGKLLPCLLLTIKSAFLIYFICRANYRHQKLKEFGKIKKTTGKKDMRSKDDKKTSKMIVIPPSEKMDVDNSTSMPVCDVRTTRSNYNNVCNEQTDTIDSSPPENTSFIKIINDRSQYMIPGPGPKDLLIEPETGNGTNTNKHLLKDRRTFLSRNLLYNNFSRYVLCVNNENDDAIYDNNTNNGRFKQISSNYYAKRLGKAPRAKLSYNDNPKFSVCSEKSNVVVNTNSSFLRHRNVPLSQDSADILIKNKNKNLLLKKNSTLLRTKKPFPARTSSSDICTGKSLLPSQQQVKFKRHQNSDKSFRSFKKRILSQWSASASETGTDLNTMMDVESKTEMNMRPSITADGDTVAMVHGKQHIPQSHHNRPNPHHKTHYRSIHHRYRGDKTTQLLLAVLLCFLITELPSGLLALLCIDNLYGQSFFQKVYVPLGDLMDTMALVNSAVNFIVYCTMSEQFREAFVEMVRNFLRRLRLIKA